MKKTGLMLKDAREKQGISLNAVSAATKISVKVLEAIEAGDASELPPKTFVRGFVQTYAMFLKLEVKAIMDVFQEEVGTTRYAPVYDKKDGEAPVTQSPSASTPAPAKPAKVKHPGEAAAIPDKPGITKWLMAGLALFLFIAIYFVSQTVQKYKRESEVTQLPEGVTDGAIASATPSPAATPAAESEGGTPEASPAASPAAATGSPSPSPASTAGPEAATASPVSGASPSPSPAGAAAAATPAPTATPAATATPAPVSEAQNLTIEALDTVKIEFTIDDGAKQTVTLEPEQKRKFSAKRSFTADISDGGAISIIHNGRDRGVPGNLGQPIKLSFPPKE